MATIRDCMDNNWWAKMYERYNYNDPSINQYNKSHTNAINMPPVISSNPHYIVQFDRNGAGAAAYNMGGVSKPAHGVARNMDSCSDTHGTPHLCARYYLGQDAIFANQYSRNKRLGL